PFSVIRKMAPNCSAFIPPLRVHTGRVAPVSPNTTPSCSLKRNLWLSVYSPLRRCKPSPSTSPWPDVHLPNFVTIRLSQSDNTSLSMLYNTHNRRGTINENESVEDTA